MVGDSFQGGTWPSCHDDHPSTIKFAARSHLNQLCPLYHRVKLHRFRCPKKQTTLGWMALVSTMGPPSNLHFWWVFMVNTVTWVFRCPKPVFFHGFGSSWYIHLPHFPTFIGVDPGWELLDVFFVLLSHKKYNLGGGFNYLFNVHSYFGKIPILTNIFQRGWNHHQQHLL